MWRSFGEEARQAIFHAQEEAILQGSAAIEPEHMLLAFTEMPVCRARAMLDLVSVSGTTMREILSLSNPTPSRKAADIVPGPRLKRAIDAAFECARTRQNETIGSEHLLLGIVKEKTGPAAEFLIESGANLARLQEALAEISAV